MCAKSHSANVERIISANNLLKYVHRNRIKIETKNNKLYIHYNIPHLKNMNPIPTVLD